MSASCLVGVRAVGWVPSLSRASQVAWVGYRVGGRAVWRVEGRWVAVDALAMGGEGKSLRCVRRQGVVLRRGHGGAGGASRASLRLVSRGAEAAVCQRKGTATRADGGVAI